MSWEGFEPGPAKQFCTFDQGRPGNCLVKSDKRTVTASTGYVSNVATFRRLVFDLRYKVFTESGSGSILTASSAAAKTDAIRKCLVSGLFPNAAYLHISGTYRSVRGDIPLAVHPTSGCPFTSGRYLKNWLIVFGSDLCGLLITIVMWELVLRKNDLMEHQWNLLSVKLADNEKDDSRGRFLKK